MKASDVGAFGRALGMAGSLMFNFAVDATKFEKAMADLSRSINADLFGPPEVTRTVDEEGVDLSDEVA